MTAGAPARSDAVVYTIPPGVPFVDALAAGLLSRAANPAALPRMTLLLPTRRAVRSLREAFLRHSGGRPLLLPRMLPLGDLDEDELTLSELSEIEAWPDADVADLAPAIPPARRQLLLTRLIVADPRRDLTLDQAVHLAAELARLLDQVHTERLNFDRLADLVPENFAHHWQVTLDFLRILTEAWPRVLAEEGCLDPADRRNRVLAAQALAWRRDPPSEPVLAAGSTGSIPATADLLDVVARLPQGAVVLPGLDMDAPEDLWEDLPPSHPQHGMGRLLARLEVAPEAVRVWPACVGLTPPACADLVSMALRPAHAMGDWQARKIGEAALEGVHRIECATPQEEATAIALVLRETLVHPGRTGALVTPDRGLARRVAAELRRWAIDIDDSAGVPVDQTPPGAFLRLTARMVTESFAPVPLLAALKHPLMALGQSTQLCRAQARYLELVALRGPRPAPGLQGLRDAVPEAESALHAMLTALADATGPFQAVMAAAAPRIADLLAAHAAMAEALAATDAGPGQACLWAGEAGEAAALFVADIAAAADDHPAIDAAAYPALLDALMAGRAVRPRHGRHPRLHIWGLLEARLQHADTIVLGGLNEGTWPPEARASPWMSRPMQASFGLPLPERRIGLTAHDFVQAFCAPTVVLSRAARVEGSPTVPSRWLLRLATFTGNSPLEALWAEQSPWHHWAGLLDAPGEILPAQPPAPTPPVEARPRQLSVTQVETWMRDPYGVYARHILGLRALEHLDADPSLADFGSIVHRALDLFLKAGTGDSAAQSLDKLLAAGRAAFGGHLARPGVWAFWWPRYERIAAWLVEREWARRHTVARVHSEVKGHLVLDAPAGPFTITARADRVEELRDGTLAIVDYKTGQPPSKQEVAAGFAPQLPLEAAIARGGGFAGVPAKHVGALEFWRLGGTREAGAVRTAGDDPAALADQALEGLIRLVAAFDFAATPYRARPQPAAAPAYSDYGHLARIAEWSSGGEEGGDGQ